MTDRELDALVAEKVMGCNPKWVQSQWSSGKYVICECRYTRHDHDFFRQCCQSGSYYDNAEILHYFTNISAAWQVVEKMLDAEWIFELFVTKEKMRATFHKTSAPRGFERYVAIANKETRAICLAALKAKGVEVKDE